MGTPLPRRPFGGASLPALATAAAAICECLHEPPQHAWWLATAAHLNALRASRAANRALIRLARGRDHGLRPTPREQARLAALCAYLRSATRPTVVLGLHAGNFIRALLLALDAAPRGTRVLLPIPARSGAALEGVRRAALAAGKVVEPLPLQTAQMRRLRRVATGCDAMFLATDLGAEYGRTVEARLFDAPAHLVAGPYLLARALGAEILWLDTTGPELALEGPFSANASQDCQQLAQPFVDRMTRAIARAPTAWTRWHTVPALRTPPRGRAPC
jgi:hypothetical protein